MNSDTLTINRERFLNRLEEMSQIGLLPEEMGGGRDRRPFSAADREARRYFREVAESRGLRIRQDGAANLSAILDCSSSGARTLLLGSHLDTVPNGGAYDGALGVLAGLEVLETLVDHSISLPFHLEVIDFTDEEGRFGNFFGSRALIGDHDQTSVDDFLDRAGESEEPGDLPAMWAQDPDGLTMETIEAARRQEESLLAFLELHIEQGPRLERAGAEIGVVDVIFGRWGWRVHFNGRSDHAGTTPMNARADALVAAAHFIKSAPRIVSDRFPHAVVTCGKIEVEPGVVNVVARRATVWVEFRAATMEELEGIGDALRRIAAEASSGTDLTHEVEALSRSQPTPMDERLRRILGEEAEALSLSTLEIPSGAGHDAQMLARLTPTGLFFVPSRDGRSHSPAEFTQPDHLVAGANLLLRTVLRLAERQNPDPI